MHSQRWVLAWLTFCLSASCFGAGQQAALGRAKAAEARQDWEAALSAYESVYDSTRTDEATRGQLWKKFAELRPRVPPNNDTSKAGVWIMLTNLSSSESEDE